MSVAVAQLSWVRDFFVAWKALPSRGDAASGAFYRVLQALPTHTLMPDDITTFEIDAQSQEELELLALWGAWRTFIAGDHRLARRKTHSIAKHWPRRSEPQIFLALMGLVSEDRKAAYEGVVQALRCEPDNAALRELLSRLGIRRPPVLGYLHRDHVLNIWLGKLRHKLRPPG